MQKRGQMNRKRFGETDRREVSADDLSDALKDVLLALRGKARSENPEPSKDETGKRYRMDRGTYRG